ncbi:MAG: O-antigen ligase family protein [Phycisphaerae bacterium]
MTPLVPVAMFGWIPLGLSLFWMLPVRKAIVAAYLIGWLFLPQASYAIAGLPDYTRMTAVNGVILLGLLLVDGRRLVGFRPLVWDLPMLIWCLCPLPTSISNDLGLYDGLSGNLEQFLTWGAPYWIGRVYFCDLRSIRLLAIGIFVGGLVYMPLCWFEIRMSPQLYGVFYGDPWARFYTTWRLGGYRPVVFLVHGIELGTWMCATALTGFWLWRSRTMRRLADLRVSWLATALLVTAVMCRSLNALATLAIGLSALIVVKRLRFRYALLVLFLVPAGYVALRAPQVWHPTVLIELAASIDKARAASFQSRVDQEEILVGRAWERPVFGWGSWGRNRVRDEMGDAVTVTDSLWIITFGQQGLVGLISLGLAFALPAILLWRRLKAQDWSSPKFAAPAVLAVCITMYATDCLMNAMLNPIYHILMGAVLGVAVQPYLEHAPAINIARSPCVQRNSGVVLAHRRKARGA